jgi:hypothetical protein
MKLKDLMGSGDKIMLLAAPFLVVGLVLNILFIIDSLIIPVTQPSGTQRYRI